MLKHEKFEVKQLSEGGETCKQFASYLILGQTNALSAALTSRQ